MKKDWDLGSGGPLTVSIVVLQLTSTLLQLLGREKALGCQTRSDALGSKSQLIHWVLCTLNIKFNGESIYGPTISVL